MRKNQTLILLGACVLALITLAGIQYLQLGALKDSSGRIDEMSANLETVDRRLAELEKQQGAAKFENAQLREANRLLQSDLEKARGKVEDQRGQIDQKVQELVARAQAAAPPIAAPVEEDQATSSSETKSAFAGMAKMLQDPAMKKMIRVQQKSMMGMTYGSLFESLDIPEADMATLKDLMLEKQMTQVDLGLEIMDKSLTDEEMTAKGEEIKNLTDEFDNKIKALLGEEDYDLYEYFEDTKGERMQISMFKQTLGTVDQLEGEQEESLIQAMQEARTGFTFSTPLGDGQEITDPGKMSPEATEGLLQDFRKLEEQYIVAAGEILTPEQLTQYKAYLEQQRSMQEMGMKMATEMFGGSDGKAQPPSNDPEVR